MTKNLFIGSKHIWFSHLSFFTSLILLFNLVIAHYSFITEPTIGSKLQQIQIYLFYSFAGILIFLTISAAFLHRIIGIKPLIVSIILAFLLANLYAIDVWLTKFNQLIVANYATGLIYLAMLAGIWLIKSMTKPKKYSLNKISEYKYLLWAWLGFLLFAFQAIINTVGAVNNVEFTCANLFNCVNSISSGFKLKYLFTVPLDVHTMKQFEAISEISSIVTLLYLAIFGAFLIPTKQLTLIGFILFILTNCILFIEIIRPNFIHSVTFILIYDLVSIGILFSLISLLTYLHKPPADAFH